MDAASSCHELLPCSLTALAQHRRLVHRGMTPVIIFIATQGFTFERCPTSFVRALANADRWVQWKWIAGGSCGVLLLLIVLSALAAGGGGGARLPDTSHRTYARFLIVG